MMVRFQIDPRNIGATIRDTTRVLVESQQQIAPQKALYAEKADGFQCRTCRYSTPTNATHGHCQVMLGTIHLDHGCCALWDADTAKLHLYREPQS